MKKLSLLVLLVTIITSVSAQTYLSLQGTNIGVGLHIGYLENESGIELSGGYNVPFLKSVNPSIFNLSVGKCLFLTDNEENNWNVTPSIGGAYTTRRDFSEYDKGGEIILVTGFNPIFTVEVGKDLHIGRVFATSNYCTTPYFGVGIRAFFE